MGITGKGICFRYIASVGLLKSLYAETIREAYPMSIKTKSLIVLIGLSIVDMVIPIPILALVFLYVVLERPPWFMDVLQEIYNTR